MLTLTIHVHPNFSVNCNWVNQMNKFFLRLALASVAVFPAAATLAADLDVMPPPPPVEELRPATYDWTGVSIGVFVAANALDGHYDATPLCDDPTTIIVEACVLVDPEMSGIGYGAGVRLGADYQMGDIVFGVMGDWAMGGKIASNDDPVEATYLNMNQLATLRGRVGWALDDTLIYASAGLAAAEMEFGGLVGPTSVDNSEAKWTMGYAVGAGIEHALTDSISVGMEYVYIDLKDTKHFLTDGGAPPAAGTVDMKYNDIHTVRAMLNYRFSL